MKHQFHFFWVELPGQQASVCLVNAISVFIVAIPVGMQFQLRKGYYLHDIFLQVPAILFTFNLFFSVL